MKQIQTLVILALSALLCMAQEGQPVKQPSLWEMMGTLPSTFIYLSLALLILGAAIFAFVKTKRSFGLWLLGVCTKFSLLSAVFCFFRTLVLNSTSHYWATPPELYMNNLAEGCMAPELLTLIALGSFTFACLFQVKAKFANQSSEPTRETLADEDKL